MSCHNDVPSSSSSSSSSPTKASIKKTINIIIITWSLVIPFAYPATTGKDSELGHKCGLGDSSNRPFNVAYGRSRVFVAIDLIANTAPNGGYKYTSQRSWPDGTKETTYGLASCRGDVSPDDCKLCVQNAAMALTRTHCPNARSAILWRESCFFKYSDVDFFGKINTLNGLILMSKTSWPQVNDFKEEVQDFMTGLITQAATQSAKFYASGDVLLPTDDTVYGRAQCARDLTKDGCNSCLVLAASKLFWCCRYRRGGHVFYDSCDFRYETYDFLNH